MGIASYDVTGDGLPEVYLTSQGDNKLQTLANATGRPTYRDIAIDEGVTATRPYTGGDPLPSTAWHPEFQDVNNDGFVDLFVSKGNVEAQQDFASRDPSDLLIGQADGTFVEEGVAAGIASFVRGRGAAVVDLNLDGMLDIVQVNRRVNVSLFRNVGSGTAAEPRPMGNWIAVRPEQTGPNRDAIGSWIQVRFGDHSGRAGAHDRRGPRERRARVGPRRARRRRLGRGPDPVARRRDRPLAGGRRERVRHDPARRRTDARGARPERRRRDDRRPAHRDRPARVRHARGRARDPGRPSTPTGSNASGPARPRTGTTRS